MSSARTPFVDRRLVSHLVDAIPGDLESGVVKAHLNNAALSHRLIQKLLKVDPTQVDIEMFSRALGPQGDIKRFSSDVLDHVRAMGGQFACARLIEVLGGETKSQLDHFVRIFDSDELMKLASINSQVIYIPTLVEGSLGCTWNEAVEKIIKNLNTRYSVEGLRWVMPSAPTVNRVLVAHFEQTGEYLLRNVYTWTIDEHKCFRRYGGPCMLTIGFFRQRRVSVSHMAPGCWGHGVGLFVLGVPA